MPKPFFVAESAQVTVLRSLASTAFGKVNLTLPEGTKLEDVFEPSAPGNELGYVASLGNDKRVGGMCRRFVRADVSISTHGTEVPSSTVEEVLDAAEERTSGDFFLESDITLAGLGPWVPMQDFVVGDTADVEIWGMVVPMQITRIEPVVSDHSVTDWRVHVGGQLVSDGDALLAANAAVHKALVEDRRELAGLSERVTQAQSAAVDAQETATKANDETQHLRGILSGEGASPADVTAQLAVLAAQLEEHGEASPGGLIPAYIAANTRRWELQEQIDETQNDLLRAQSEAQDALARQMTAEIENVRAIVDYLQEKQKLSARQETKTFTADGTRSRENDYFKYELITNPTNFTSEFVAKGTWRGEVSCQYAHRGEVYLTGWSVPEVDGSRKYSMKMGLISASWFTLTFTIDNGTHKTREITGKRTDTAQDVWNKHPDHSFTATSPGQYLIYWEVAWAATTYHSQYAIRVTTSKNRTLGQWGPHTKVGPLLPGFDGSRTHYLRLADQQLQAGEQVFFETFTDATEPSQRAVRATMTKISWIEEN